MEVVTEFIKAVSERFRNPFLFSLSVALVFANWEIPIALFWDYQTGTKTLVEYIEGYEVSILGPIGFASFYSLAIPIIGQFLKYYNTVVNTEGNERALKRARRGVVSGEIHFEKMNELQKQVIAYSNAMSDYDIVKKERDELHGSIALVNQRVTNLENEKSEINKEHNFQKATLNANHSNEVKVLTMEFQEKLKEAREDEAKKNARDITIYKDILSKLRAQYPEAYISVLNSTQS